MWRQLRAVHIHLRMGVTQILPQKPYAWTLHFSSNAGFLHGRASEELATERLPSIRQLTDCASCQILFRRKLFKILEMQSENG